MANEYFGKVSEKGIQIIPVVITAAALGTLGSLVGLILSSAFQATTKGFLAKKVHILLTATGIASGEGVIIGVNANDSGIASGYASVIGPLLDPNAREAYLTAAELVKTVWHETPSLLLNTDGDGNLIIDKWVSLGGGKGIPSPAGAGPEIHAYNPFTGALTTGGIVSGVVTFYGVWLED